MSPPVHLSPLAEIGGVRNGGHNLWHFNTYLQRVRLGLKKKTTDWWLARQSFFMLSCYVSHLVYGLNPFLHKWDPYPYPYPTQPSSANATHFIISQRTLMPSSSFSSQFPFSNRPVSSYWAWKGIYGERIYWCCLRIRIHEYIFIYIA